MFEEKIKGKTEKGASIEELKKLHPNAGEKQLQDMMSKESEKGLVDDLLDVGDEQEEPKIAKKVELTKKKDFQNYGEDIGVILAASKKPKFYVNFFESSVKKVYQNLKTKDIADLIKALNKVKDEKQKQEDKSVPGKKDKKAKLKSGGQKAPDSANAMMMEDLLKEDDYEDYGDYGDEGTYKEEDKVDHDFM